MFDPELITMAKASAATQGLDPALVCAVIEQESSWNTWAVRYEPGFYEKYIVKQQLKDDTEAHARTISWGLMQLMGEVAREEHYTGPLPKLCDPQTGIDAGLIHLERMLKLAPGDVHAGLQHWNGGGNPNYADEVLARMPNY
jgi:soluble lytic murein transglycosylase-like protein